MANTPRIQSKLIYSLGQPAIPTVLTPDLPEFTHFGCGCDFTLKALADNSGDPLKNDKAGFLWWFNDTINAAQLTLQKWSGSAWVDVAVLVDNTYGTNYAFEFFTNEQGENFIGYQLEWALVLDAEGEGSYRVICATTDYLAATNTLYSYEYCLKTYSPARANGTIRIEYYNNGVLGRSDVDEMFKDFGDLNWYNAFRLNGWFGFPKYQYEKTNIQYNNGQILNVTHEQTPRYELQLKMQPDFVHEALRIDAVMSDAILITDYNNYSPKNYVSKRVIHDGNYEPDWNKGRNKLADVKLDFLQEVNLLKKYRF